MTGWGAWPTRSNIRASRCRSTRLDDALIASSRKTRRRMIEIEGDHLVIKHLYIERRMVPLNLFLQTPDDADIDARHQGIRRRDQGTDAGATSFPATCCYKNFGVTRHGRVVFYDYDEIEYLTDCNVRKVPQRHATRKTRCRASRGIRVGPHDIFPETYGTFLLGDPRVREAFMRHHADFFDPALWQRNKDQLLRGELADFFPYDRSARFCIRYPERFEQDPNAIASTRARAA